MIITIDGPSGVGKSSMAKLLAAHYSIETLDTGAMYRSLAYISKEKEVDWTDEDALVEIANDISIKFINQNIGEQLIVVNKQLLQEEIRTLEIGDGASIVSSHKKVREIMVIKQREIACDDIVAEGRDMGTVVFPYADIKFYLDGSIVDRAHRRSLESGIEFSKVCTLMNIRDQRDMEREHSPLTPAVDSIQIDTTDKSIELVFEILVNHINHKLSNLEGRKENKILSMLTMMVDKWEKRHNSY